MCKGEVGSASASYAPHMTGGFPKPLSLVSGIVIIISFLLFQNRLAAVKNNLGCLYSAMQRHDEALKQHQASLEIRQQVQTVEYRSD